MSEKLGIGYIGIGTHWGQSHGPFMVASPLSETVGVADVAGVNVDSITDFVADPVVDMYNDESGVERMHAVEDYGRLLRDGRVHAVVVATRDDTHYGIAKDALEVGKHVLGEKPAAANLAELAALPDLFDLAEENGRRLWVCHPREFGEGPWRTAAQLISNPGQISETFEVGPMGRLRELRHDCHYTVPGRDGLHTTFADDKLNHTIVSVLRSLPGVTGFRNAVLYDSDKPEFEFDARLVTISENKTEDGVVVRAGGRRSAHSEHHGGGVWRDWIEAVFDEGVLRVEPTLGRIALTYGKSEKEPIEFDPDRLYDDMFGAFNDAFVHSALDARRAEPLMARRVVLLGTAAAILMQQPGFNGEITEDAVRQLSATP
jgi:predicted dehydrogenase